MSTRDAQRGFGRRMTRRAFVGSALAGLLSACAGTELTQPPTATAPTPIPPTQTAQPAPTSTQAATAELPQPSATPKVSVETSTPQATPIVAGVRPLSAALSRVVAARDPAIWSAEGLSVDRIALLLDTAIAHAAGLDDPDAAWRSLFRANERVAIKVNTIAGSSYWTRPVLVEAVTARLLAIGLAAEQIVVFDRSSSELAQAGFTISRDGPGVRCYGTDRATSAPTAVAGGEQSFSDILLACDALINMPILKTHSMTGISFALKNAYGSIDQPGALHRNVAEALPALNATDPIRRRTRLVIGDALEVVDSSWSSAVRSDALLVSVDPVAVDAVALRHWGAALEPSRDLAQTGVYQRVTPWLDTATTLGLGRGSLEQIDLVDVRI